MPEMQILVVDDEEPIRDVVSSMLSQAGYKIRQAASGLEALELLDCGENFELVLTDMMMPELDGIGLLEKIKERFPEVPVVMVTAVHDISVALAAIRNGAYDYLLKPFEREQLLVTIRRALETRNLKIENHNYQMNLEALVDARTEQLRQAMGELERSYDITLEALGDALDLKDAETVGHSKRVTAYTIKIAGALNVPADTVRVIARGAFLHDIGKMAIPDIILNKPASLTPAEVRVVQEHCWHGYQMLRKIPFLQEAAEIVYTHQERFDGTGYPRGSEGAKKFPWGQESSPLPIPWTRLPPTGYTGQPRTCTPPRKRSVTGRAGSLTLKSSRYFSQFRTRSGSNSATRSILRCVLWCRLKGPRPRPTPDRKPPSVHATAEGGRMTTLSDSDIRNALAGLPAWNLSGNAIQRVFEFSDFAHAMEFVNQVAAEAEEANHHPDILINYSRVTLTLTSHDAGGLTKRDVAMARKISSLSGKAAA